MTRLTLAYAYGLTVIPPKARQRRRIEIQDTVGLDVPDVSAAEAPEAVRVSGAGVLPIVRRLHDGALYAAAVGGGDAGTEPVTLTEPVYVSSALFGDRPCPWDRLAYTFAREDEQVGSRVFLDERDATRASVTERARDLLIIIDGGVWVRMREPALSMDVTLAQVAPTRLNERPTVRDAPSFVFGLDRRGAFDVFVREAGRTGLKPHDSLPAYRVDTFDPGASRMAEDVLNAATALRYAVRAAGHEIDHVGAGAMAVLAEAKLAADRIECGRAIPADATALLDRMAAEAGPATPRLSTAVAVGRMAIAASRPSPRGAFGADGMDEDAAHLAVLAP